MALYGDLGAGKTAFVRGFASILAPGVAVHSPTFALVNEYRAPEHPPLFHFDMYRIGSEDELYSMGYEDYLDRGICLPMRTPVKEPGGARISRMPCLPSAWKCASERMRRIRIGAFCRYA